MSDKRPPKFKFLERLADENGVAIAVLNKSGEVTAASNNNSICQTLYGSAAFGHRCAADCGTAYARAEAAGEPIDYTCHAGLRCRAMRVDDRGRPFVAIVGRTFTSVGKYREGTERALGGDWRTLPPAELFANVLISGSDEPIEKAAAELERFVPKVEAPVLELEPVTAPVAERAVAIPEVPVPVEAVEPPDANSITKLIEEFNRRTLDTSEVMPPERRGSITAEAAAVSEFRSLLGRMMELRYREAAISVVEFVGSRFGLSSLVWLERNGEGYTSVAATGEFRGKTIRVRLDLPQDQLAERALAGEAIDLKEKRTDAGERGLRVFPVLVGSDVRAALGIRIASGKEMTDKLPAIIARLARAAAPQMEILRLRDEVMRSEAVAAGLRRFNEGLRHADSNDFWQSVAESAAEVLGAERVSILTPTNLGGELRARSMIGTSVDLSAERNVGGRISRTALESGKPIVAGDLADLGIASSPDSWNYRTDSFISFPIAMGEKQLAVLNVADRADGGAFTADDLEILQALAPQLAVAIDRRQLEARTVELEKRSITDSLTGLMNRGYIEERLIEEMSRANRYRTQMSLLMIDVDNFKSYNDTFGHPAGDVALVLVSKAMKDTLRAADVAARYGGEEFAILLPQTDADEAASIAERLRQRVERTEFPRRQVTISVGFAEFTPEFTEPRDWITAADMALYDAKELGKNRVRNYADLGRTFRENVH
ncbi:MAG: diguanylate cyclase [Acidobacteria bacterium]|nr:diguanylate cyclase [Acidobacteriota bacterium]